MSEVGEVVSHVPPPRQRLSQLPGSFAVAQGADAEAALAGGAWLAAVRAPEGLTVVWPARAGDAEVWSAFYGGASAHGLDVPGMLAALVKPLAEHGVPVFVASTFRADVVLVPADRRAAAADILRAAGHDVEIPISPAAEM
ncbi:MAG TPA: ACT domain-containing protein [Actinocrinis sp.]|jgi:hypothetical protein